jgi:Protein of unknown function (DUF2973)
MLHIVYILAFTIIAFLAIGNLVRSLISLSSDTQRLYPPSSNSYPVDRSASGRANSYNRQISHPELLDETGKLIDEPLLVMRSVSVEDARQQLDSIYNASPSGNQNLERDE